MGRKHDTTEVISSLQNPKVRNAIALQKSRERRKQNLFLVEGRREVERALKAGYSFRKFFICRDLFGDDLYSSDKIHFDPNSPDKMNSDPNNPDEIKKDFISPNAIQKDPSHPDVMQNDPLYISSDLTDFVSPKIYAQIAYRGTTEGILGWAEMKRHNLDSITLTDNPLVLVVDAVEKPGNLGAILRTVDAAGIDALIISDSRTDVYNPNVVRSSLGALFTTQVGIASTGEVQDWLKKNQIRVFCTSLTASKPYTKVDYSIASAIVMGTEAMGLPEFWLERSDQNIIIPMHGTVDSMNVSVSAGIVLFEALRQRGRV